MLRRIILATDFSTRSDRLLLRSKLIARETGAEIVLVHVVDDQQPERLLAPAMMEARALLCETANTLREEDGLTATFTVKASDISAGILAAADEAEADLIMLGSPRNRAFGTRGASLFELPPGAATCGAQAYVRVILESTGGELLFCAHHARKNEQKLRPLAATWQDETERIGS